MVTLHLRLHDGRVSAVTFEGVGCSISQASASMLTEVLTNTSAQDAAELARSFRAWMQGADPDRDFGDLEALAGVRSFPMRVKCATLAWNTLLDALSRS
jgi:nitrogen fixation NifU-like protein